MPPRCRRHDPRRAITLGHNPALLRQGPPAPRSCRDHLQPRDGRHRRMLSHTPMSRTLSPLSQGGPPRLAITHIFPCSINGLLASLKGVSFRAEPFEGAPFRVILSGSNKIEAAT